MKSTQHILAMVVTALGISIGLAVSNAAPPDVTMISGDTLIQAERGEVLGGWKRVSHPWASGGEYLASTSADGKTTVEFPIQVDRDVTLTVSPLWWRHGEQKTAQRFPANVPFCHVQQVWPMAYPDRSKQCDSYPFPVVDPPGPGLLDYQLARENAEPHTAAASLAALLALGTKMREAIGRAHRHAYGLDRNLHPV